MSHPQIAATSRPAPCINRAEPLAGLTMLVTGAGRGIGRACALACAAAGAGVIAVARTEADLFALSEAGPGRRIQAMVADVTATDFPARISRMRKNPAGQAGASPQTPAKGSRPLQTPDHIKGVKGTTVPFRVQGSALLKPIGLFPHPASALPRLDELVNNAGTNRLQPLAEVDTATLDHLLELNVRSAFLVSQAAAVRMIELGRGGSIVHVPSQMGHVGGPRRAVYCMTKHAVEGLTKAMAIELAPAGIRVNAVAPTIVETSMTAPFFEDAAYRAFALATIPMGRVAQPEDVAEAVVYLASPAAGLVSGTSLRLDGGATAQ